MHYSRLFDCLEHQLAHFPKKDMLVAKEQGVWKKYSTQDVAEIVNRFSAGLLQLGVSGNDFTPEGSDKIAIISCTGANLEEDVMNLVAHSHYKRVPNYRDLTPQDEWDLLENHYNRVTDTCIPEEEAFRRLQKHLVKVWKDAEAAGERYFPHEFLYKVVLSGDLEQYYEIDPKNSWIVAAAKKNIPIIVPGWEDSTTGNIFASYVIKNELKASTVKNGIEYMVMLTEWYRANSGGKGVGFFQVGGGIAGEIGRAHV
jgi:deoxyhypusine synthase